MQLPHHLQTACLVRTSHTLVLALRRARLKSPPSDLVGKYIASVALPKACFRTRAKKIRKSVGAKTQLVLFDTTANVKGLGGTSVELHCPLHVAVEGLDQVLQLWWAADPLKHLEQPVSANQVERFW